MTQLADLNCWIYHPKHFAGSKRLLSTVFHQLESRGVKTKRLWHDIKLILVKTTLAMLPEIMLHYEHHFYDSTGPQCFQVRQK